MAWIFEVEDKSGRKIYLSDERWAHLNQDHPEVAPYLEDIKEMLKNPLKITDYEYDDTVKYYYKYFKERGAAKYLLVIVKYLNQHGFIITAYFVRNIK
jgi:hypothetical protein